MKYFLPLVLLSVPRGTSGGSVGRKDVGDKGAHSLEYLIIGAGRVGISLALALQNNWPHFRLLCHSDASSDRAVSHGVRPEHLLRALPGELSDLLVAICVPDDAIAGLAEELSRRIRNDVCVFHTSGILGSDVLGKCAEAGAAICAAHPYQAFFVPKADFPERYMWGIESPTGELSLVESFIGRVGAGFAYLPTEGPEGKALYHASAVLCSNYMNTVISLGKSTARLAGVNPADFLPPILETTLANNIEMIGNIESPMTGPIAREDIGAVEKHIAALSRADCHLRNAYVYLTLAALEDSIRSNSVSNDFYSKAKKLLLEALI